MQHRIVVLGAGYTGASAAVRLARRLRREDVAITLVNAEPDFVELGPGTVLARMIKEIRQHPTPVNIARRY